MLEVNYPMDNGIVRNFEDMKAVWDHTFYDKLKIDPKKSKVLLTEPPMNPKSNRERLITEMFETFVMSCSHGWACWLGLARLERGDCELAAYCLLISECYLLGMRAGTSSKVSTLQCRLC